MDKQILTWGFLSFYEFHYALDQLEPSWKTIAFYQEHNLREKVLLWVAAKDQDIEGCLCFELDAELRRDWLWQNWKNRIHIIISSGEQLSPVNSYNLLVWILNSVVSVKRKSGVSHSMLVR